MDGGLSIMDLSPVEIQRTDVFEKYLSELLEKRIILESTVCPGLAKIISPADGSRYTTPGRKRMKAKIYKRLGSWINVGGVLLTLTFAPGKIDRDEAWTNLGKLRRAFMNKVNQWRRRHGYTKARCLSVVELQRQTGYPHVHIVFPGLKYLAPIDVLTELWGMASNSVDIKYKDQFSPVSYICKYITKMDAWDAYALAYLWANRTRIYSMSRDYVLPDYSDKPMALWRFTGGTTVEIYKRGKASTITVGDKYFEMSRYDSGLESICGGYTAVKLTTMDLDLTQQAYSVN